MSLFWMLSIVLSLDGCLMVALALAHRSARLRDRRIFLGESRGVNDPKFVRRVAANSAFSGALVFVLSYLGHPLLIHARATSVTVMVLQGLAILGLYDVAYYFMHRYAFHQWGSLKRVHAVHHAVRHPTALDSLYLHPLEAFLGLALLLACIAVVGPVNVVAFVGVFTVYSLLNIVIHCGLSLPVFPLRAASYMARKHDAHHTRWGGGNFASITPICDLLFGTAE